MNGLETHWGENDKDYENEDNLGPYYPYNEKEFLRIKKYAESQGWSKIRWYNGYILGYPGDFPWIEKYKEYEFIFQRAN
jgi:hypothetical protein